MESLELRDFLSECQHVPNFKRVVPMIIEMVSLRCDAAKARAHRFKLYPDVAKLDLLARHLYIFQFETYIQAAFIKRDFQVLAIMMGLDKDSVTNIMGSVRGAPHVSGFSNEEQLLNEAMKPFFDEVESTVADWKINEGQQQWILGYFLLEPQILNLWNRPDLSGRLIEVLDKNLSKYFGHDFHAYKANWQNLLNIQIILEKNCCSENVNEESRLVGDSKFSGESNDRLIFDYPADYGISIWLGLAVYVIVNLVFYVSGYLYWGLIISILPSAWIFNDAVVRMKLTYTESQNLEIFRGGETSNLSINDILRIEKSKNFQGEEILIIFRNTELVSPVKVQSTFDNYGELLNRLENMIGDRILDTSNCINRG